MQFNIIHIYVQKLYTFFKTNFYNLMQFNYICAEIIHVF